MLGVQLYDLISQAGLKQEQVVAFYSFMSQLGMAAQAIDIVYQLNASEDSDAVDLSARRVAARIAFFRDQRRGRCDPEEPERKRSPARLSLSRSDPAQKLQPARRSRCVAGRCLRGGFCRIYPGQRILVGDQVLTYQELAAYFNAKKNVSLPQIFVRVHKDGDEVQLERSRSRESALEVTFGLKVRVKALRDVDAVLNNGVN